MKLSGICRLFVNNFHNFIVKDIGVDSVVNWGDKGERAHVPDFYGIFIMNSVSFIMNVVKVHIHDEWGSMFMMNENKWGYV